MMLPLALLGLLGGGAAAGGAGGLAGLLGGAGASAGGIGGGGLMSLLQGTMSGDGDGVQVGSGPAWENAFQGGGQSQPADLPQLQAELLPDANKYPAGVQDMYDRTSKRDAGLGPGGKWFNEYFGGGEGSIYGMTPSQMNEAYTDEELETMAKRMDSEDLLAQKNDYATMARVSDPASYPLAQGKDMSTPNPMQLLQNMNQPSQRPPQAPNINAYIQSLLGV